MINIEHMAVLYFAMAMTWAVTTAICFVRDTDIPPGIKPVVFLGVLGMGAIWPVVLTWLAFRYCRRFVMTIRLYLRYKKRGTYL